MDHHQDQPEGHEQQGQAVACAAARLAEVPSSHAHPNTELGADHLLGLLSCPQDVSLQLSPP
jgi:hypothetical protein